MCSNLLHILRPSRPTGVIARVGSVHRVVWRNYRGVIRSAYPWSEAPSPGNRLGGCPGPESCCGRWATVHEQPECFPVDLLGSGRGHEMARSYRSAITGRYISKAAAVRHPQTSVSHAGRSSASKGTRSAISGRFVKESTAKRHPDPTIQEG